MVARLIRAHAVVSAPPLDQIRNDPALRTDHRGAVVLGNTQNSLTAPFAILGVGLLGQAGLVVDVHTQLLGERLDRLVTADAVGESAEAADHGLLRGSTKIVVAGQALRAEAGDLFDCLVRIRMDLEKNGAKILCNGARLDAYPSRMARDMGGGRKVYLMRMGEVARPEDLVGTFDEAPIEKIGSVDDQRKFYLSWIESVRSQ